MNSNSIDYSKVDSSHFTGPAKTAFDLASQYHAGQTDKAGHPYIAHPCRVASSFEDQQLQIIALLHDTLEDTALTSEAIRRTFGNVVADTVIVLSHGHGEPYMDYIHRVAPNPLARQVKLADLTDNMRMDRLKHVTPADMERLAKYQQARDYLLAFKS